MKLDAIVIGSGPNGLAAAITLARAGWSVAVLEAAPRPGGAVVTEELTLPGFSHDTFSAVYPAAAASPVFARFPLHEHGLRWVHPEACFAHPLSDGTGVALYRDLDRTAASLDALAPGQGDGWRDFVDPAARRVRRPAPDDDVGLPAARRTGQAEPPRSVPRRMLELGRLLLMPAQALGEELFSAPGARAWLYGSAMHGDVPPSGAGSAIAAVYLNLLGHGAGWPSPEGGAGRLASALVSYLTSLGGSIRTDAEVVG